MDILLYGLAALATPAAAGYWWARSRRPAAVIYSVFHCPRCRQKLRYPANHAGRQCMCPRCLKCSTLPVADRSCRVSA